MSNTSDGITDWIAHARTDPDWRNRRLAILKLSHEKDAAVLPALLECLDDSVSEVRHAAVVALGRLGDRQAVTDLRRPKVLSSPDANLRWAATAALGRLGDHRVIDDLAPLADDEEWVVRNEALDALKAKVAEIIDKRDVKTARVLMRMLTVDDEDIVAMAVEGLSNLGKDCSPLVEEGLDSVRAVVRRHTARTLGLIGDPRSVPRLIDSLSNPDPGVRAEAAGALGRIRDRRALRPLVAAMRDNDDQVRSEVVRALVKFGGEATEVLTIALGHSNNKLARCAAVSALGAIRDERAIPILIEQLGSSYYLVRTSSVAALSRYGNKVIEPLLQMLSYNTSSISHLTEDAGSARDPHTRRRAIRALGDLEDHRAVPHLKALLSDPDRSVSLEAQEALIRIGCAAWGLCGALSVLGRLGAREAVREALNLLGHDSTHVRQEAIRCLGELKAEEATESLIEIAKQDPAPDVRREALLALRELATGSERLFVTALGVVGDPSLDVRGEAARILGDFVDERATRPLVKLLSDTSYNVRYSAENALCSQGKRVVPDLVEVLRGPSLIAKRRAASALGRLGDRLAIEPLEQMLSHEKDPSTVRVAKEALKQLRGETGRSKGP